MPKLDLPNFLDSLSIASATENSWRYIIAGGLDTLAKIRAASPADFAAIKSSAGVRVGERGQKIWDSLHSPRVEALLDRADAWLDETPRQVMARAGEVIPLKVPLVGKNVCMTGTGPLGRGTLADHLRSAGATVQDSVNSATHILICESATSTSSKATKARKLGVTILGYSDVF